LNEDGSANSLENPAARGSVVSLFATGLGVLDAALPDDAWTPLVGPPASVVWTPAVYIQAPVRSVPSGAAGMPALFAGPAPGQAPGVYQMNVRVPELALTGMALFQLGHGADGLVFGVRLRVFGSR